MMVAFQEGDREKVRTAGNMAADVVGMGCSGHGGEFAAFTARSKGRT